MALDPGLLEVPAKLQDEIARSSFAFTARVGIGALSEGSVAVRSTGRSGGGVVCWEMGRRFGGLGGAVVRVGVDAGRR